MSRQDTVLRLVKSLPAELNARIVDLADGWPSAVAIDLETGPVTLDVYIGQIGDPGAGAVHARAQDERRFQNPAGSHPIQLRSGTIPLLVGWSEEAGTPALVAFDPFRRVGRGTRQSYQLKLRLVIQAVHLGWSVQLKNSGEVIVAMLPHMLPFYLSEVYQLIHNGDDVPPQTADEVDEAGALIEPVQVGDVAEASEAAERLRQTVSRLLRSPRFRREVLAAYGKACAMCGVQLGLVQAAHIYPASEVDSPDTVDNGLCLCPNHHQAFDQDLVRVVPETLALEIRESEIERLRAADLLFGLERFSEGMAKFLGQPRDPANAPDPELFRRRYRLLDRSVLLD